MPSLLDRIKKKCVSFLTLQILYKQLHDTLKKKENMKTHHMTPIMFLWKA